MIQTDFELLWKFLVFFLFVLVWSNLYIYTLSPELLIFKTALMYKVFDSLESQKKKFYSTVEEWGNWYCTDRFTRNNFYSLFYLCRIHWCFIEIWILFVVEVTYLYAYCLILYVFILSLAFYASKFDAYFLMRETVFIFESNSMTTIHFKIIYT